MPFVPQKPRRKIAEDAESYTYVRCDDPEHEPPGMMVFREDGYWSCPKCGKRTIIHIPRAAL